MQTAHWLFTASKWLNPIQTHWCLIGFPASHTFCVGFQTTCILPNYDIEMFIWSKGNRMICVFLFNFVLFFLFRPKNVNKTIAHSKIDTCFLFFRNACILKRCECKRSFFVWMRILHNTALDRLCQHAYSLMHY